MSNKLLRGKNHEDSIETIESLFSPKSENSDPFLS